MDRESMKKVFRVYEQWTRGVPIKQIAASEDLSLEDAEAVIQEGLRAVSGGEVPGLGGNWYQIAYVERGGSLVPTSLDQLDLQQTPGTEVSGTAQRLADDIELLGVEAALKAGSEKSWGLSFGLTILADPQQRHVFALAGRFLPDSTEAAGSVGTILLKQADPKNTTWEGMYLRFRSDLETGIDRHLVKPRHLRWVRMSNLTGPSSLDVLHAPPPWSGAQ